MAELQKIKLPDSTNLTKIVSVITGMIATQDSKCISALAQAKSYTDSEVQKINVSDAKVVDAMPTYSDGTITYVQSGVSKTTTNLKTWFWFTDASDKINQTIYVDGQWLTIKVANDVDFSDYAKVENIVSTYTGTEVLEELTKIASIGAVKALDTLSESKYLKNTTETTNAGKIVSVSDTGTLVFTEPATAVTEISNDDIDTLFATT